MAHRGASAEEPENTLPAFESALRAGADAIELDVRLSSDGVPVVLHDANLSVTTDGRGFVHDHTLAELKRLDASMGRGSRAEIPTLAEVLELLAAHPGATLDMEVKNLPGEPSFDSPEESVLVASLAAIEAAAFDSPVLVTSFNWLTIERSKELAPHLATGFLTVAAIEPQASLRYAVERGHEWVLPHAVAVLEAGEAFVQAAQAEGVRVGTWTVDDEEAIARLFGWGVDAVASNRPAVALEVRDRVAPRQ